MKRFTYFLHCKSLDTLEQSNKSPKMSLKLPKTMGVFKVRVDFTFFGSRILTNQIIRRDINPYKAQMKVVSINLFVFFRLF